LKPSVAEVLIKESNGDAIVRPGDVQLPSSDPSRPEYWKLKPILPGDDCFLEELHKVVKLQIARKKGDCPTEFYGFPKIMIDGKVDYMRNIGDPDNYKLSLEDIANAVKNEYPVSIQQTFIKEFFKTAPKDSRKIILNLGQPFRSAIDFIGMMVRMARINAWSFEVVAPVNFMLKWHYGMSRPEEVAWLIDQEMIEDDLASEQGLVEDIKSLGMESRKDFTAYNKEDDNGSPTHPSFPAMHSAGSTLSTWLPALFKLTCEEYEQALLVDHAVAFARTVAGVHYEQDNIAGLNVGQRIIREQLPALAAREYGCDETLVRERLDKLSFDWKCFDSKNKKIGDQTIKDFYEAANKKVTTINGENIYAATRSVPRIVAVP
jgi:membrane-associated phospholipid phosphatase